MNRESERAVVTSVTITTTLCCVYEWGFTLSSSSRAPSFFYFPLFLLFPPLFGCCCLPPPSVPSVSIKAARISLAFLLLLARLQLIDRRAGASSLPVLCCIMTTCSILGGRPPLWLVPLAHKRQDPPPELVSRPRPAYQRHCSPRPGASTCPPSCDQAPISKRFHLQGKIKGKKKIQKLLFFTGVFYSDWAGVAKLTSFQGLEKIRIGDSPIGSNNPIGRT